MDGERGRALWKITLGREEKFDFQKEEEFFFIN